MCFTGHVALSQHHSKAAIFVTVNSQNNQMNFMAYIVVSVRVGVI